MSNCLKHGKPIISSAGCQDCSKTPITLEGLVRAQDEINKSTQEFIGQFGGIKIIKNDSLPPNEFMIVCGENAYKIISNP